jgi:hypothetical protein
MNIMWKAVRHMTVWGILFGAGLGTLYGCVFGLYIGAIFGLVFGGIAGLVTGIGCGLLIGLITRFFFWSLKDPFFYLWVLGSSCLVFGFIAAHLVFAWLFNSPIRFDSSAFAFLTIPAFIAAGAAAYAAYRFAVRYINDYDPMDKPKRKREYV